MMDQVLNDCFHKDRGFPHEISWYYGALVWFMVVGRNRKKKKKFWIEDF